jgi:hypothetical protein
MSTAEGWAYAGYLLWLLAGCLDFGRHRRTDLAHTSGLAESRLHGLQLLLLGGGVLAWLALAPSLLLGALLLALVIAHAIAGYADTRSAYGRRPIDPREQHLHSVLDMAPWFALCFVVVTGGAEARSAGWTLAWRGAPAELWLALLLPPLPLCIMPWMVEYRAVLRARRL